ncbi:MAG TPA: sigma-54 dependent transcriptional regulator [Candidatus Polarisedimenticolia bacterium]|nr:sigma-54 dependent transcriptional regulator [Candidatus Polarisedimenticolia bacterium]
MSAQARVLVVEDDADMRLFLQEEMRGAGYDVVLVGDGMSALEEVARLPVDVVITDVMMPGLKGSDLLVQIRGIDSEIPVVLITAFGSIESAVEAVKAGAFHYVSKPFRIEQLLATVESALRERRLRQRILALKRNVAAGPFTIVAQSATMKRVLDMVSRAASAPATPVLLLGESGTGKELLARALHRESARSERRFLAINCSAIPEALLESQLFGHRRGAFTDAREDRRGLFQEAEGGTLLLDEIGDMPLALQGKLLRVLQEREVHPIGAPAPIPVDVRIIASTHRDLEAYVREGRFRQDLFYRLNVVAMRVPPLRERPEDLLPLVAHFLEKHGTALGRPACTMSAEATDVLRRHQWPGNVRELENAVERALVLGRDDVIRAEDLPEALRAPSSAPLGSLVPRPLAEVEREHILRALRAMRNNKTAAARLLGFDRKTLYRKLRAFGIELP